MAGAIPIPAVYRDAGGGAITRRSSCTAATVVAHGAVAAEHAFSHASLIFAEAATAFVTISRLLDGFEVRACSRRASAAMPGVNALFAETTLKECLCCRTLGSDDIVAAGFPAVTFRKWLAREN